ncbi:hypothetical protein [Legionella septentrionalis]|uniref:hypothetical protein n=1 Tax=Legionella septentrionalis TaxID=2498109 RepID=UPI000F8EB208|nr:hypothetical protein [Legionella septentrionalis]RUQ95180.1 hypothetical protein ELY11_09695 [Legionella septentrionalis]RUR08633.1 hypothetical protein ELY14_11000 [Legionella septentrionalis]RUR14868.1 hypothetical protein ELY10_07310 [Legionella septentrionalis]
MTIGLHMLYSSQVEKALNHHFEKLEDKGYVKHSVSLGAFQLNYFLNDNVCVVSTPVLTQAPSSYKTELTYQEVINFFKSQKDFLLAEQQVIIPVIGAGNTERHITVLYKNTKDKYTLFDSKLSNPSTFLNSSEKPGLTVGGLISAIFRSVFNWNYSHKVKFKSGKEAIDLQYEGLGTQSTFDGVSCGFHALGMMQILANDAVIGKSKNGADRTRMLKTLANQSPVSLGLQMLDNSKQTHQTSLTAFLKNSWYKTFNNAGEEYSFAQYFLGAPKSNESKLWFATTPLVTFKNTFKLVLELPLSIASGIFDYLRNALYQFAPTRWYSKMTRTLTLALVQTAYALTEGVRRITNFILSPIEASRELGILPNRANSPERSEWDNESENMINKKISSSSLTQATRLLQTEQSSAVKTIEYEDFEEIQYYGSFFSSAGKQPSYEKPNASSSHAKNKNI